MGKIVLDFAGIPLPVVAIFRGNLTVIRLLAEGNNTGLEVDGDSIKSIETLKSQYKFVKA